ncbi:MAG: cytosolic protein [Bacteroidetes bacterium]|nr:cytosolic protein [Bacteroidota bacterium]
MIGIETRLLMDLIHRTVTHHAMWYAEVYSRLGREKAMVILDQALRQTTEIQLKRLSKTLGFELDGASPAYFSKLSKEEQKKLMESLAINWLANDGIWFQALEFSEGMTTAKACNDACWGQFSPFEAMSIKRILGLDETPGLDGLKRALQYRLYAFINVQSFAEETPTSFVFRMNDCRVQFARKRKGLDDYPCKSAGLVEYTEFAHTIDPRITTTCICCPPDPHPDDSYCSWQFSIH